MGLPGTLVGPAVGTPKHWTPEVFVEKAGLSDTVVLSPPRRKQPWFLRTTVNQPQGDAASPLVGIEGA